MRKAVPYILLACFILAAAVAGIMIYSENNRVDVTVYEVSVEGLPKSFEGFKIAQISDFHNNVLGEDNCLIIDAVEKQKPDIIVITGDYLDSRNPQTAICNELTEKLVSIAPVYYVTGNHEHRIPEQRIQVEERMSELGVHILRRSAEYIEHEDGKVQIVGTDDPTFYIPEDAPENTAVEISDEMIADIDSLCDDDCISILLAHRPALFEKYADAGADVIFAGHEHGGQFRLPFIGGVFAPDEHFFPKYSEGMRTKDGSTLIISRGLGQSVFPFRINNSPELTVAELKG